MTATLLLLLQACVVTAATSRVLVVDSRGRTSIAPVLRSLLHCEDPSIPFAAAEQCAMVDADVPSLHNAFKQRVIHFNTIPLSGLSLKLETVDNCGTGISRLFLDDSRASMLITPSSDCAEAHANSGAATHVESVTLHGNDIAQDVAILSAWMQDAAHTGRNLQSAAPADDAAATPPRDPWASWLGLSVQTRIAGALALAAAAIGLVYLNFATLSDEIVSGSGHSAASAATASAAHKPADAHVSEAGTAQPTPNTVEGGSAVAPRDTVIVATAGGATIVNTIPSVEQALPMDTAEQSNLLFRRLVWTLAPLAVIVIVNLVCDRLRYFPIVAKMRESGTDMFWSLALLTGVLVVFFTLRSQEKDADALMAIKQTDEAKGWMMFLFLIYHYWDVKSAYNLIRLLVSTYVFFTGFGNTISLASKPPTLQKFL